MLKGVEKYVDNIKYLEHRLSLQEPTVNREKQKTNVLQLKMEKKTPHNI